MMHSHQLVMSAALPLSIRRLCFRGSIVQGSAEHAQLATWTQSGLANRPIWALCDDAAHIDGKPSSYVLQSIRDDAATQCGHCRKLFYPSRKARPDEGLYCRWQCSHDNRYKQQNNHRGLGQVRRKGIVKRECTATLPLIDYHLISESGVRATVSVRGNIDAWLRAENSLRRRRGLDSFAVAQ